jgi:MarR family transcriptional repressor of mepA
MFTIEQFDSEQREGVMNRNDFISRELKILNNKLNRRAEALIPPHLKCEVTEMQGRTIGFLFHHQGQDVFQKDVEAEFAITRATASKMLTQMEASGLITRRSVPGDARLKKLELTEKALHHMEYIRRGMLHFEEELTRGLNDEEKAELMTLLRKLETNVDTGEPCSRKGETIC